MLVLLAAFFLHYTFFFYELNFDPFAVDVCGIPLNLSNYSDGTFFVLQLKLNLSDVKIQRQYIKCQVYTFTVKSSFFLVLH